MVKFNANPIKWRYNKKVSKREREREREEERFAFKYNKMNQICEIQTEDQDKKL